VAQRSEHLRSSNEMAVSVSVVTGAAAPAPPLINVAGTNTAAKAFQGTVEEEQDYGHAEPTPRSKALIRTSPNP